MDIILLLVGMALILVGADWLTDGASSIAKRFNIPTIVIGLTIVAFGTSTPELAVCVSSVLKGSSDLAIGNIVGSNIFNTLVIVGCTATFVPIAINRNTLRREIPLSILSAVVLLICANDILFDKGDTNVITTSEGLILLCFFVIFLGYTFAITFGSDESGGDIKELPMWKSVLYIPLGIVGLAFGGQWFVDGASGIARSLGVSESVIGLTLVAGGTSLPELATSIVAAVKKQPEMAIGNAIGSNLFNIFLVLGCTAVIAPMPVEGIAYVDWAVLLFSGILLWVFALVFPKRVITRREGVIMVLCYVAYLAFLLYNLGN